MALLKTAVDHLAVGARTLEEGVNFIRHELGVEIPPGGVHPHMGTHNHLMRLGENMFLEVLAINPEGASPTQPRWFGLDDPAVRHSIARQPRLLTWVANTTDLAAATAGAALDYGTVNQLSRGDLRWSFALPEDGRLLAAGMLPYLMQWSCEVHPSSGMAERDCELKSITLRHANSEWLGVQLRSIAAADLVHIETIPVGSEPEIVACVATPGGEKYLSSRVR
jgi:hypothetical protein